MPVSTVQPYNALHEISPPLLLQPVKENIKAEDIYGPYTPDPKIVRRNDIVLLAQKWISDFNTLLSSNDYESVLKLFAPGSSWKDHLCLSWEFHQFHDADKIEKALVDRQERFQIKDFKIDKIADNRNPEGVSLVTIHEAEETTDHIPIEWLQVYVTFKNKFGPGKGVIRLISTTDGLKAYTVFTTLDQIYGNEEKLKSLRPEGVDHGQNINRESWLDQRKKGLIYKDSKQPVVLIVGGGQSGLNMAARLKVMGIDSLIIEQNDHIGDNWRKRYSFLVLHDPVYADHLAYLNFPDTWPVYTPKDKLGNWFESYADSMELNVWNNTTLKNSVFDSDTKSWLIEVLDLKTNKITKLNPKHLIMATGHSGEPNIPHFKNEENFKGVLLHSSQHKTGRVFQGENALVVGSCNSAHDIAQDFYEQGAKVTMVQRSSTYVNNVDKGSKLSLKGIYEEGGPANTETADLLSFSSPIRLQNLLQLQIVRKSAELEKPMIDALGANDFKLDYGYGGTGMYGKYYRRGGGYYIDVGGSSLIVEGKIKMKQGTEIESFTDNGVVFKDGSKIDNVAIVVLATGYKNMKTTASRLFGDDMASKLSPAWGLNDEGEFNAIFTDSGHENFWYAGGNLTITRYYSKKLAMRIIAQERGFI